MNICRERFTRVKHAMGLRAEHIDLALADAGLTFSDVDYCAVSTSQGYPATFFKGDDLLISYGVPDVARRIVSGIQCQAWSGAF